MSANRISLAEQLKQISDVAPADLDPEDTHLINSEEQLNVNAAARDHYVDVGPSFIRMAQESVSDSKYDGVSVSRNELLEIDRDRSEPRDHDMSSDENEVRSIQSSFEGGVQKQQVSRSSSPALGRSAPHEEPDLARDIRQTRIEDQRKGLAVSRQISLWNTLLDARIGLQKAFSASNRLPPDTYRPTFSAHTSVQVSLDKMLSEATLLSDELFSLQEHLLEKDKDIQLPPRKRRRADTTPDHATSVAEATRWIAENESVYHAHLIRTLSKWSSKIQSVAPAVLLPSSRNSFSRGTRQEVKNVVQLIDEMVADQNEWNKLIDRTRVWRGKGQRLGSEIMPDRDEEVFDDIDFYQQLLRDVIDSRTGEQGNQDWTTVQKEKKRRKNVDNKASKGRKLRYEAHERLQNFMVPIPVTGKWHDEQIDELFASLLGKGFENAMDFDARNAQVHTVNSSTTVETPFRIFG